MKEKIDIYDYETLLKRAQERIPKTVLETSRFEIPKVISMIQGNRTFIKNFGEIASQLQREPAHIFKFMMLETASKGIIEPKQAIINGKFGSSFLDQKINEYVKEFVICPECKKPDTKLEKEQRFHFLKCMACGSRHSLRKI